MFLIIINLQFEGYHRWAEAPAKCLFLQSVHRHIFHVTIKKQVTHTNRDIEFITYKNGVLRDIEHKRDQESTLEWSCESWAYWIAQLCEADAVRVMEDGENGAEYIKTKQEGGSL